MLFQKKEIHNLVNKRSNQLSKDAEKIWAVLFSSVSASLTSFNDFALDPEMVSRITNAVKEYGVSTSDVVKALPGELEKFGTAAVENFTKAGDEFGKHWSHIKSQSNNPELVSEATNAIWEDGLINFRRNSADMKSVERIRASFDNHLDGLIAAARTHEFWERSLGNAFEASVYAACLTAIDQLLINREVLINGSKKDREQTFTEILKNSGLMAAGAIPVSVFLGLTLMIIPGATMFLSPLGVIGSAGIGFRVVTSVFNNPSQQEKNALKTIKDYLKGLYYDFKRDNDGSITINIKPV